VYLAFDNMFTYFFVFKQFSGPGASGIKNNI
jgi:hypothetical protein